MPDETQTARSSNTLPLEQEQMSSGVRLADTETRNLNDLNIVLKQPYAGPLILNNQRAFVEVRLSEFKGRPTAAEF